MFKGLSRRVPALLAVAIAAAVAFSLWETRGQTLFSDEWGRLILAQQDSLRTYLLGYSGHLIVLHALLYRGLFGIFGADSYVPFRVLEALLIGLNGWLFFMLARWRATPGTALAATLPLLFLGSAFEVTATPFGIVVLLPMAFGLGALVCMTRLGRAGDPLACGKQAHVCFTKDANEVKPWGPSALDFLRRYGVK